MVRDLPGSRYLQVVLGKSGPNRWEVQEDATMSVAAKKGGNLVLKRDPGQGLIFEHQGVEFTLTIERNGKIVIHAPPEVKIRRSELSPQVKTE
jgi:sRNA-binding carbon storage regulator CsrA